MNTVFTASAVPSLLQLTRRERGGVPRLVLVDLAPRKALFQYIEHIERGAVCGRWCGAAVPCHGAPSDRTLTTAAAITTVSTRIMNKGSKIIPHQSPSHIMCGRQV